MRTGFRQLTKQLARRAVIALDRTPWPLRYAPPVSARVLTYHRFQHQYATRDPSWITCREFQAQMEYLARMGKPLDFAGISALLDNNYAARNTVLVTIDDAHISGLDIALPIMEKVGMRGVFFVPTGRLGSRDHFGLKHVRSLHQKGFTIGSHSNTHHPMAALSLMQQYSEARISKQILEDAIGEVVDLFAYPYGTRSDFNRRTGEVLREVGYRYIFSSQYGVVTPTTEPSCIPRINIEGTDSIRMFKRVVEGGLDGWRMIDRHLWWLQGSARREELRA